jgi:hypothetical protein
MIRRRWDSRSPSTPAAPLAAWLFSQPGATIDNAAPGDNPSAAHRTLADSERRSSGSIGLRPHTPSQCTVTTSDQSKLPTARTRRGTSETLSQPPRASAADRIAVDHHRMERRTGVRLSGRRTTVSRPTTRTEPGRTVGLTATCHSPPAAPSCSSSRKAPRWPAGTGLATSCATSTERSLRSTSTAPDHTLTDPRSRLFRLRTSSAGSANSSPTSAPQRINGTLLSVPAWLVDIIGRLDLTIRDGRIADAVLHHYKVDPNEPPDPGVKRILDRYLPAR